MLIVIVANKPIVLSVCMVSVVMLNVAASDDKHVIIDYFRNLWIISRTCEKFQVL
jgi:hypothetical protein